MAVGYSVSDGSMHPAIRYAGRLVSDPLSTLGQTETSLIEGPGSQSGNCGGSACARWGDYSAMTIDPDGCRFWYTNEYYGATGLNWLTRFGSFKFSSCTSLVLSAPSISGFNPSSGAPGTSVTITGSNFTGATTVAFNGLAASSFTVNSSSQITAVVPGGATTGPISVVTGGGTGTSGSNFTIGGGGAVLAASPSSVPSGGSVTVNWSGVANPTPGDWIGLYRPGDPDIAFINWIYDSSCTQVAGTAKSSGSCSYPMTVPGGTYELRLFSNDGFTLLATSNTVSVTSGSAVVAASPASVPSGGSVTVNWSGVANATPGDWIGLYRSGDPDLAFISWIYDSSCTQVAGIAKGSGSCSYPMTVPGGTYELRLFSNDGFTLLATSNTITVT